MSESSRRALWWLRIGPLLCVVAIAAFGFRPTRSLTGPDGIVAMIAAQVLVLLVVYATLASTIRRVAEAPVEKRLALALKAGVIRFLLTLLLAAAVVWQAVLSPTAFLVWVAISYVVVINAETVLLVRWMATLGKEE